MNAGVGRGIELFEHFLRNMFAAEALPDHRSILRALVANQTLWHYLGVCREEVYTRLNRNVVIRPSRHDQYTTIVRSP